MTTKAHVAMADDTRAMLQCACRACPMLPFYVQMEDEDVALIESNIGEHFNAFEHLTQQTIYECLPKKLP